MVKESDWPRTMNVVIHRNIDGRGRILDLAEDLGADRIELANTQYYGWARLNRAALLPPCPSWTGPRSFIPLRVDLLSGTGFSVMAVVLALEY